MFFINYTGATMTDDDSSYTISIDNYNNKGYKGDDDFVEWMTTEAPLINSSSANTVTLTHSYDDLKNNWQKKLSYSLPVDLMHNWYPEEMKEKFDDDLPF